MQKNVLITGGAGFIGSHLVDRLLKLNYNVICIDNFDNFYSRKIKEFNLADAFKHDNFLLYEADINDSLTLNKIFENNNINLVIHLAAKAGVIPSVSAPLDYINTNITGTLNLLEAMKNHNVKDMIFASSSSVYGNKNDVPFNEKDFTDNTVSPYAASKKAGELLCHTYHYLYKYNIFCLRFFTVYGPRQRPDLAIHKFADKIIHNLPIDVYGDGNSSRDYTYIDDIINAVTSSIEHLKGFEIFNVGESEPVRLKNMITLLEDILNKKAKINMLPVNKGEVHITYADISKARDKLNYKPLWPFKKGLNQFVEWKMLMLKEFNNE